MKKGKKFLSLLLAGLLAVSILSACGNGAGSTAGQSGTEGNETGTGGSATDVVEVNVWGHDMDFPAGDRLVAYVEDKFGLKFTFSSYPWGTYQENLRVELGAGNVPDMFPTEGPGDTFTMYDQLYEEGLLQDLTDILPSYQNLAKNMVYDEDMLYTLQSEGRLYGVPRIWNKDTTDRVFMIRKDWLDMLDLDMPATWDDLKDVLQAFKDAEPDGNAQVGLTTNHWAWLDMLVYPGFTGVSGWYKDDDGNYQPAELHPLRKTGVEYLAGLYADGLLDPEIFVHSDDRPLEYFTSGRSGVAMQTSQYAACLPYFEQTEKNFPDAEVAIINPLMLSPDGIQAHGGIDSGYYGMWAFSKDFEHVDRVLEMMDWLASPEGTEFVRDGIEGIHYTIENGEKVFDEAECIADEFRAGSVTSHYISYFVSIDFTFNRDLSLPYAEQIFLPSDEIGANWSARNPVKGVPYDDDMTAIKAAMDDIVSTYSSQIITGQMGIDQYDEMLAKLEDLGVDYIAEQVTAFMQANGK